MLEKTGQFEHIKEEHTDDDQRVICCFLEMISQNCGENQFSTVINFLIKKA